MKMFFFFISCSVIQNISNKKSALTKRGNILICGKLAHLNANSNGGGIGDIFGGTWIKGKHLVGHGFQPWIILST